MELALKLSRKKSAEENALQMAPEIMYPCYTPWSVLFLTIKKVWDELAKSEIEK